MDGPVPDSSPVLRQLTTQRQDSIRQVFFFALTPHVLWKSAGFLCFNMKFQATTLEEDRFSIRPE